MKQLLKMSMLYVCIICLLLQSCKKDSINPYEGKIHVEGQVLEKGKFPNPIPNAMVILYRIKTEGFFEPIHFIPIDTVWSDKDGNYLLERVAESTDGTFHISASADPEQFWNRTDEPIIGGGISEGKKTINTLFIQPYGFVKMHIKNIMPVNQNDVLILAGGWSGASKSYIGADIDEIIVKRVHGNDTTKVSYGARKDNLNDTFREEKYFLNPHDTLKININY